MLENLPTVTFGKYKGQPITTLMSDTKYVEWLSQQEGIRTRYPTIFNIVVNQNVSSHSSKTPEHNKMQNKFLDKEYRSLFTDNIFKKSDISIGVFKFEDKFNWDVSMRQISYVRCKCVWDDKLNIRINECDFCKSEEARVLYKHCIIDCGGIPLNPIYIELKPVLGDDYPTVLRKMTAQKELTAKYLETCFNKSYDEEYWQKFNNRCDKHICFKYERSQYIGIYCLFVKEFNSSVTTKEQLKQIFQMSNIRVIFEEDLIKKSMKV